MTITASPSAFLVQDAFAIADEARNDSPAAKPPVHVAATGQFGSSTSFTATQAGNQIVWTGSASTGDGNDNVVEALASVLLKYVPDRAMKLTATVNAGWVASAPPPSGTARIGAQVQTSHGDAVAHFARAGDTVLDARLCASVQVAAGDTVFILFEGLAGAGASGAGDGATVTFEDVP